MRSWSTRLARAGLATVGTLTAGLLASSSALAATPEKPLTKPASEVTGTAATLHSVLNPKASATTGYYFIYSTGASCAEGTTTEQGAEATGKAIKVQTKLTGLIPHTLYAFCVVATNAAKEETPGAPLAVETAPLLPLVQEESSSAITETSATLSARVNPESQETTCKGFQFISDARFKESGYAEASQASCEPEALGSREATAVTVTLTELVPNTTYHYRVLAENGSGQSEGEDHAFLTLPTSPIAITGEASAITASSATVSGAADPGSEGLNSDTIYFFEYGPTTSYGQKTATQDAGQGTSFLPASASLTGLERDTLYHYRIVATNNNANIPQTFPGADETFITAGPSPVLSGISISAVTQSSATFSATIDSEGLPARYELKLGTTQGQPQSVAFGDTSTVLALDLGLGSLSPGTVYYYRLLATNENGTTTSPEGAFATARGPAPTSQLGQPQAPALLSIPQITFPSESAAGVLGSKTKGLTNARKLAKALKACARRSKRARTGCERLARRRYKPNRGRSGHK